MQEETGTLREMAADHYDPSDRPFDDVEPGSETALVCETDATVREALTSALTNAGYHTTQAESAREALKRMRFHLFDVVILDEHFDRSASGRNEVLAHLRSLNMAIRRQMFLAVVSDTCRTMDNMAAFLMSANVIINRKQIDKAGSVLTRALADHAGFYRVMLDTMKRLDRR